MRHLVPPRSLAHRIILLLAKMHIMEKDFYPQAFFSPFFFSFFFL